MGTRADFYLGIGKETEWLGSIPEDGYPRGVSDKAVDILDAKNASDYRAAVAKFLAERDTATTPDLGWPWPWEDSRMTDWAYCFDPESKSVQMYHFGTHIEHRYHEALITENGALYQKWIDRDTGRDTEVDWFPDMSARKNVTFGKRSGLIVLSVPPKEDQ